MLGCKSLVAGGFEGLKSIDSYAVLLESLVVNPSVICFVSLAHELKSRILVPLTSEEHYQLLKFWNLVHHDVSVIFKMANPCQSPFWDIHPHTIFQSVLPPQCGVAQKGNLCAGANEVWIIGAVDGESQRKGSLEEFCGSWISWSMWSMAAMDDQAGIYVHSEI